MAEALQANIEWEQSHGLFVTAKHLTLVSECLTTLSLTVLTQRNFVADFLQAKSDFTQITRLTDERTDRETDTFRVASPRWHSMQHGKK